MSHMKTRMMLLCQLHRETCTLVTSLLATDLRMMRHMRIITVFPFSLSHVAVDDIRILTMYHDGEPGGSKDLLQSLATVNEHITCRTTHKEFDAWNAFRIQLRKQLHIIIRRTKVEAVVHMALLSSQLIFILKGFDCRSLRNGIRHIKISRDTTCRSRTTLAVDIGLLRQTWLTEMHMVVDHTRQNKTPRSIYDLIV